MMEMPVGLFGKIPARGDFLSVGLGAEAVSVWDPILAAMTETSRDRLGDGWADLWDCAPVWGFWIGFRVRGGPAAGVIRPSRDKVGRRFPLLLLANGEGGLPAPPVIEDLESRDWFALLSRTAQALTEPDFTAHPADLLGTLAAPPTRILPGADPRGAFYAEGHNGLDDLFADIADHDHGLASSRRSYWWTQNREGKAILLALDGLPDAAAAVTLLEAMASATPEPAPEPPNPMISPSPLGDLADLPPSEHASPFDTRPLDLEVEGDESPFGGATSPQPARGLVDSFRRRH